MASFASILTVGLALTNVAVANPVDLSLKTNGSCNTKACILADLSGSTGWEPAQTLSRNVLSALECRGQSCLVADTAGSTTREPTMKAEGASDADIKCIASYNPVIGQLLKKYE
jgi:hypothetical protein